MFSSVARYLMKLFSSPIESRAFWGRHIWARGYFVASSGNVTDEVIMKYIEEQSNEPPDGDFKIDDDL